MNTARLVVFKLDDLRYAFRLSAVRRVVRVVEIIPLPCAPPIICGVINLQGEIVPVINVRERFRLPPRQVELSDQFIIAQTSKRRVAVIADAVLGVMPSQDTEYIAANTIAPGLDYIEGVVKLNDGMVFIHNLDTFLSLDEEGALDDAMAQQTLATK